MGLCVPRRTSRVLASVGNVVVYGQPDGRIKCSEEALMSIHESLKVSPPRFQDTMEASARVKRADTHRPVIRTEKSSRPKYLNLGRRYYIR